ncbi:MAG TPA: protein kinase [Phycisphaerae bacterium]|nr:protein kinase [Phycisphaerae bacterium]
MFDDDLDDSQVERLLEQILESGDSPEEVCRPFPQLLPKVRASLRRLRAFEEQVGTFFPPSNPADFDSRPSLSATDMPIVPGYEVLRVLGRGGMGVVYLSRHLRLNRPVALKMLLAGQYARPDELERFLRESEAIAALHHPNIVQVFDAGDFGGRPYFAMEFVEGGNLAREINGVPQPAPRSAELVAMIADAVHTAHQRGIVHRDLKPANILLASDGTPKVTDFGLARQIEGDHGITLTGLPIGTPSYMAPEQIRGDLGGIGPATDVYSLGAILYELLTGRPPFRAETTTATFQQVMTDEPIPPTRLNPRIPRDLENICLKCLDKDPHRRYPTAAELTDDLHRFERGEPVVARAPGRLERIIMWARRRPTVAALSATLMAIFLLLLALIGVELHVSGHRQEAVRAAEQDLREANALLQKDDLAGARAALERAKGRVSNDAPETLTQLLVDADHILKLLEQIDAIRLDRSAVVEGHFRRQQSDKDYEAVFQAAGFSPFTLAPQSVAYQINHSAGRGELIAALDDWALCAAQDEPRRVWLMSTARLADPHPWRDRVRDPSKFWEKSHIEDLAKTAPVQDTSLQILVGIGERLHFDGNDAVAASFLSRVQKAHPNDFYVNFWLSHILCDGQPAEAVRYAQAAIALRPDAACAYNILGVSLLQNNEYDEALPYFRRASQLDPLCSAYLSNLGDALRELGRTDEAIDAYDRALRLDDKEPSIFNNSGLALDQKGRLNAAIDQFQRALRIDPHYSIAHYNLARIEAKLNRYSDAIQQLREAVSADPKYEMAQETLGDYLVSAGRSAEAIAPLQQAVSIVPTDSDAQQLLRDALIDQGRLEDARITWRNVLDTRPSNHDDWFGYAELCLYLGNIDEYQRNRIELLALFANSASATICERTAKTCLLMTGDRYELQLAAALADRAEAAERLGHEGSYPFDLFAQGLAAYRLQRFDAAIALMNGKAANVMGPCPKLITAMALYQKGEMVPARKVLSDAIRSFNWSKPDEVADPNFWIAHILRREAETLIIPATQPAH